MSEIGWKEGDNNQRKQEVKGVKRVEKTHKKVREDAKIGRIRQAERAKEQEKA